ncbi:MAG: hypothetical protein GIW95_04395 [Candidatus Eremiobacteraeota bacterium]|nr:hypothetical protein [Candidatus Eremiobacteraeota bacterium]
MRDHARYESLGGAVALGEASAGERAEFGAHAAGCKECADAAGAAIAVRERFARAEDSERWSPSLETAVAERIHERRNAKFKLTTSVLAYAIGASVIVNVGFVSGLAGRALDGLRVVPDYRYASVQRIAFERRATPVPVAVAASLHRQTVTLTFSQQPQRFTGASHRTGRLHGAAVARASRPATDVLSGLRLDADPADSQALALMTELCGEPAANAARGDAPFPDCANLEMSP